MKRLLGSAIVLACAFLLLAAPASAAQSFLYTWTLPSADVNGNTYTTVQQGTMTTELHHSATTGFTPDASTLDQTSVAGATSRVVTYTTTPPPPATWYFRARTIFGTLTSAASNQTSYDFVFGAPLPPTLVSVVKQ